MAGRQQRLLLKKEESTRKNALSSTTSSSTSPTLNEDDMFDDEVSGVGGNRDENISRYTSTSKNPASSLIDQVDRITDGRELVEVWQGFQNKDIKGKKIIQTFLLISIHYHIFCAYFSND